MDGCWARWTEASTMLVGRENSRRYSQSSHPRRLSYHSTPVTSGLALRWGRWCKPRSECLRSSNAGRSLEDEGRPGPLHKKRGNFQKGSFLPLCIRAPWIREQFRRSHGTSSRTVRNPHWICVWILHHLAFPLFNWCWVYQTVYSFTGSEDQRAVFTVWLPHSPTCLA